MPTEFQKVMDLLLEKFREVFVFNDDILIVTKNEHLDNVRKLLKTLDNAELQLKAGKCRIAQSEIEGLGFKMTKDGISPVNTKVKGITEKLRPENLKELRSFFGQQINSTNSFLILHQFVSHLDQFFKKMQRGNARQNMKWHLFV